MPLLLWKKYGGGWKRKNKKDLSLLIKMTAQKLIIQIGQNVALVCDILYKCQHWKAHSQFLSYIICIWPTNWGNVWDLKMVRSMFMFVYLFLMASRPHNVGAVRGIEICGVFLLFFFKICTVEPEMWKRHRRFLQEWKSPCRLAARARS